MPTTTTITTTLPTPLRPRIIGYVVLCGPTCDQGCDSPGDGRPPRLYRTELGATSALYRCEDATGAAHYAVPVV